MEYIEWTEELSVGIETIDAQHLRLVELINAFYSSCRMDVNEAMSAVLKGLFEYTVYHFAYEEELLIQFESPDRQEHMLEHDRFKDHIQELRLRHEQGEDISPLEVSKYLREWLVHHIQGTDQEYAELFIANGVR